MVERIAVAVVRRLPEHRDPVVVLDPTQLAVVRDVTPDEIAPLSAPRRSLVVHPSREEPMDPGVVHPKGRERRVDGNDVGVRVGHRARAGGEITRRVGDDARRHAPRRVRGGALSCGGLLRRQARGEDRHSRCRTDFPDGPAA